MRQLVLIFWISLLIGNSQLQAQEPQTKTASEYYEMARIAYAKQEYQSYVENLHKVVEAGTEHPFVYYSLAAGYALLNKQELSISWLSKIADLGIVYDLSDDKDFTSVVKSPAYQQIKTRFDKNLSRTNQSQIAFTIPDRNFVAEGVTYDPSKNAFFVSSIIQRKIVRIDEGGKVSDFTSAQDQVKAVLGMSIDPKRRILWASSATMWQLQKSEAPPESEIYKYDLESGKLLKKYPIDVPKTGHQLGDVIVNSSGDAFTTDSFSPAVYKIGAEKDQVELFLGGDTFRSPQGLCFSPDEKTLFVADYVRGIFAIDVETKQFRKLSAPENTTVAGIDGLYFYKGSLIGTQNGFEPNRVLRLILNQQQDAIEKVEVLESNHKLFDEITLGTIANGQLYYVGNGQLNKYLNNPKMELNAPLILKLNLERNLP